jgi:type IV pilus assembly protein PilO
MNDFVDRFNAYPLGQRILGLVVVAFLVGIGAQMLLLAPLNEEAEAARTRAVDLQREKQTLDALKKNRAQVLAQLEQLKRQLLIAQEKLPKGAEIPSLLQRIHNQAKTAGLEIVKFQRNSEAPQDFYVEIPVEMELNGTYDELANFFYYIGRMTRIVNVAEIGLVRTTSGLKPDGSLKVNARATTFRFKTDAELAGGGDDKKKRGKK